MKIRRKTRARRGTSMAEAIVVLLVFLTMILSMMDLAIAVFRHHVVAEAARMGARTASVHGSLCPSAWNGGPWGTAQFGPVDGNSTANQAACVTPYLSGLNASSVNITMTWPDGKNTAESRVSVTVSTTWTPIMTSIFGGNARTLSGNSVMLITH
jgi:hypothetical protein